MIFEATGTHYNKRGAVPQILEWLDSIIISLFIIIIVFTFFFSIVGVSGPSMLNTLVDGDKLVISDVGYTPKNGDIVIISRNYGNIASDDEDNSYEEPIVKRVIAVAGQTVEIKDGDVYVDDVKLEEDYITSQTDARTFIGKQTVPEGHIFVLGDNRIVSHDSRSEDIGMVDERYVMGKVLLRFFPITEFEIF